MIITIDSEKMREIVSKIMAWEDITDAQGRTLVTSWAMGAKVPTEVWC